VRDNSLTVHRTDDRPLPGSLEVTGATVEEHARKALLLPMDLTDRPAVEAAGRRLLDEWGGVEVLVHNGRYLGPGLMDVLLDTPLSAYEKTTAITETSILIRQVAIGVVKVMTAERPNPLTRCTTLPASKDT
jgi:NAD(P)-dependent dehydrogenase (short-subunit alcohol dehydrogenase family)